MKKNVFWIMIVLFAVGCGKTEKEIEKQLSSHADMAAVGSIVDMGSTQSIAPKEFVEVLKPGMLNPIIQTVGDPLTVPSAISVVFARNVLSSSKQATRQTVFNIEPPISGTLRYFNQSNLSFSPSEPFRPSTKYKVSLEAIESRDGVLKPEKPWTMEFTTPDFAFMGLSGGVLAANNKQAEVDVRFSAPVNHEDLKKYATWSLKGKEIKNVTYSKGYRDNIVHVFLNRSFDIQNKTVKLDLKDIPYKHDAKILSESGSAFVDLEVGPTVKIYTAEKKEGPNGYYIQVICYDKSAPGGYRYFYSDYDSYRVSRRCLPTEESIKHNIKIYPKVPKMRIASGRGGFNILGDFSRGVYNLQIEAGLKTIDGGIATRSYEGGIHIPSRTPAIRFTSKGRYLPKKSWKRIPIQNLNNSEAAISVRYVPKRNVAFWLSGSDETIDGRTSTLVSKKVIKLNGKEDRQSVTGIDIRKLVDNPKPGVYAVSAVGSNGGHDTTRVVITDMNLIVKRSEVKPGMKWSDEVVVWVLNMETNLPKTGVAIKLIRLNGEVFADCKTNSRGTCTLNLPESDVDNQAPFAITAEYKDDFTFLKYSELKTSPSYGATFGTPYYAKKKYSAAVYADRDVYRPGETGHFVAVLRNDAFSAPNEGLPVEVKFYDPRRKFLKKRILRTNEAGIVHIDQTFPDFASTGAYSFEVSVGKKLLSSYRFNVEEFVPERMKVSASIKTKNHAKDDKVSVDIEASYLFGGSAKDSPVELKCSLKPSEFKPKKFSDYRFGSEIGHRKALDLGAIKGVLGEEGELSIECPSSDNTQSLTGTSELMATASVFEAGSGRTSTAIARTTVHASPYHIGLKTSTKRTKVGQSFEVEGVLVDIHGKIKKDIKEVEVEFMRLEYDYYWYSDDSIGEDSWGKNLRPVVEGNVKAKVKGGKFKVTMTPTEYASRYVVVVKHQDAKANISVRSSGWRYSYYDSPSSVDLTPRPTRPTVVNIEAPKAFELNQQSDVVFDVPFSGRMLITVESSKVLEAKWMDVKAGKLTWKYTPKTFIPNIYISALVVKDPFLDTKKAFMPDRAFGVKSVPIKPSSKLHEITIKAPKEVRPNSKLDLQIDVGKAKANSYITVAAIDEGILSLTKFKTPDLSKQIFARRRLGVETFETVGWTVRRDPAGPSGRTGGGVWDENGGLGDGLGRVMAVKPVSLWSGLVKVGADGKAKVSFDIPTYRGALRVMVVSVDKEKTGTAETRVLVRDPLVLQATLPRFLSAGDDIFIPVFVTNMTGSAKNISVRVDVENIGIPGIESKNTGEIVKFLSSQTQNISAKNNESQKAIFKIKSLRQAGAAKFRITATADGVVSYTEGDVPFRPSGPTETITKVVELSKGKNDLTSHFAGWVPTSEKSTIWVTNNPYGRVFDHLKYVVRYPYGCIEQTTSSTRPLFFVADFITNADPEIMAKMGSLEKMVNSGINRVFSMQTGSGGFAYWPGGSSPNPWGTAYATHMLLDAKDKGYDVPEDRLTEVLNYIETTLSSSSIKQSYYHSARAYLHYVSARAKRANRTQILRLIEEYPSKKLLSGTQKEEVYLLQAALYLSGDRRYKKELLNVDTSKFNNERETRWSYYSDRRRRAFILSVFFDLFGKHKNGEKLAKMVAKSLSENSSRYYTTQEITWGITGLGKWIAGAAKKMKPPILTLDGKKRSASSKKKTTLGASWAIPRASEYPNLVVNLPSKDGKVFAIISSSGVRVGAKSKTGGKGLSISRTYYDLEGKELEPDEHTLGDIIFVKITITNTTRETLHNLALVDRFAGGFEVENPSFGRGSLPDWVDTSDMWKTDHMNVRDDRIEAFGSIKYKESVKLMYTVRAVSAGRFLAPAPEIEGMYDPEKWAREEPSIVQVKGPWK